MAGLSDFMSWEEQVFAADASGRLGSGCVWPPRRYSCGFCLRDFKSAQALGGHMNVHRRDRARLNPKQHRKQKQSLKPTANFLKEYRGLFSASQIPENLSDWPLNIHKKQYSDVGNDEIDLELKLGLHNA